jgi:nitrate/nitrite-specific signal transduction histidine kinase
MNPTKTTTKIQAHYIQVKELISTLRRDITQQLKNFEQSIDEYAEELRRKTNSRDQISQTLNIPL